VLKQVEIMGMTEEEIEEAVREAHILQSLNHHCIVKFMGEFRTKDGYLNILMSYADGGDLNQRIKEMKSKREVFSESQLLHIFTQVCLAVQHVHERRIIHRDIKSHNVFLTKEGHVKLGDFGIARPLQLTLQKIKSVVGTPYYMSPEICDNKEYSLKTDIWSLGVLLLEMCLLKPPFDAGSLPALALKISKG
jgi:NIMA (never in mitosis gene a)-related kinase 1/4/5